MVKESKKTSAMIYERTTADWKIGFSVVDEVADVEGQIEELKRSLCSILGIKNSPIKSRFVVKNYGINQAGFEAMVDSTDRIVNPHIIMTPGS